jgi:hypothetical protein
MSLDGFIAGPGHDMSWTGGAEYDTSSELAHEVARSTGVVLAGRGWYDVASADEGGAVAGIYGGAWSGPVLVLTHRPERLAADATVEAVSDLETRIPNPGKERRICTQGRVVLAIAPADRSPQPICSASSTMIPSGPRT